MQRGDGGRDRANFMLTTLGTILESDVIVVGDYYFVDFEYDSILKWLMLRNGHCITQKKNRLNLKFDKKSLENCKTYGNVVDIRDVKGKQYYLELMDLAPKKI